jgi:hypothetical protein
VDRSKSLPSRPGRRYALGQDGGRDLQNVRQSNERRDAGIAQSSLDPGDLGHVVELLFSGLGIDQLAYADPFRLEGLAVRCRHAGARLVPRITLAERVRWLVERDRIARGISNGPGAPRGSGVGKKKASPPFSIGSMPRWVIFTRCPLWFTRLNTIAGSDGLPGPMIVLRLNSTSTRVPQVRHSLTSWTARAAVEINAAYPATAVVALRPRIGAMVTRRN